MSGLLIAAAVSWWLLLVGVVSVAAGWLYTGGPRPYGYMGLGELFVFVFFGLVATLGTQFVVAGRMTLQGVVAAVVVGLLAVALLVINNLRDIPGDSVSGKVTLAVRLGDAQTRVLYVSVVVAAFIGIALVGVIDPPAFVGLLAVPLAVDPIRRVRQGEAGANLIPVLGATARVQLVAGLLLAVGLALAGS
jgi:1,4-dihydroxy-2-naphthoate octaprenyltransferase